MVHQIEVHGEQIILGGNGALVASHSEANAWHVVKLINGERTCDCKGWKYRGNCRHVRAVEQLERERAAKKTESTLPPRTRENAPLAGPPLDAPLFPESKSYVQPKPKTFEELFPAYA